MSPDCEVDLHRGVHLEIRRQLLHVLQVQPPDLSLALISVDLQEAVVDLLLPLNVLVHVEHEVRSLRPPLGSWLDRLLLPGVLARLRHSWLLKTGDGKKGKEPTG